MTAARALFWFALVTLLGSLLAAPSARAQTRNPLRHPDGYLDLIAPTVGPLTPPEPKREERSGQHGSFWLISDDEDLPAAPPPLAAPTRNFVLPHDQPEVWPDRPFPTRAEPRRLGMIDVPPDDPDFDAWDEDLPRHPRRNQRFTGWGQPLYGTSWLNRPYYVGAHVGQMFLDDPLFDVQQSNAAVLGLRLGWDFDYYWGLEGRFGYAKSNLSTNGTAVLDGLGRDYFVDLALMWYPTGDSRWRPFLTAGVGAASYRFQYNRASRHDTELEIPLGVGLKYFLTPWSTLRWEFQYAPSFGTDRLDTMHNFMIGLGAEIRFGGMPRSYFPWTGNTAYW